MSDNTPEPTPAEVAALIEGSTEHRAAATAWQCVAMDELGHDEAMDRYEEELRKMFNQETPPGVDYEVYKQCVKLVPDTDELTEVMNKTTNTERETQ